MDINITETRNIARRKHLVSATICPGGEQVRWSLINVSEDLRPQHPSNQHKYTKMSSTIKVGANVPYKMILLKNYNNEKTKQTYLTLGSKSDTTN